MPNMMRNDSVRPSCLRCVYKHLAAALITGSEYLSQDDDGSRPYRCHLLYVTGNLQQAEEQAQRDEPEMAKAIRSLRIRLENAKWDNLPPSTHVPTTEDIQEILGMAGLGLDGLPTEEVFEFMEPEASIDILGDDTDYVDSDDPVITNDAERLQKEDVDYTQRGGKSPCEECSDWQGLNEGSTAMGTCGLVSGNIFRLGTCNGFTKKK